MPVPRGASTVARVSTSGVLEIVNRLQPPRESESLSAAVEYRLRTGIGIGLLGAEERLPSEQIVARKMGVSTLTLRQSLDRLRYEGLVRTKPGRGGGTFISASAGDLDKLAASALAARSLTEIGDLGVAVAELHSASARLAATRHDRFDDAILTESLGSLQQPLDAIARRRNETIYTVAVARAARNERLMAALIPLIGELQSMAWANGATSSSASMEGAAQRTVAAILASRPDEAADGARDHAEALTAGLLANRTAVYRELGESRYPTAADAFGSMQSRLLDIRDRLSDAVCRMVDLPAPSLARSGQSEAVDQLLRDIMNGEEGILRGAGLAYAPGILADTRLWMDWWDNGQGVGLAFKSHVFSSRSLQYYDYESMPWFTEPLRTGDFSLLGPYLDRGGIETMTITASLPVKAGPYEGCVIGADLDLPQLEHSFFVGSGEILDGHVLVNSVGRVVASALPTLRAGALLAESDRADLVPVAEESGEPVTGWRLLAVRAEARERFGS